MRTACPQPGAPRSRILSGGKAAAVRERRLSGWSSSGSCHCQNHPGESGESLLPPKPPAWAGALSFLLLLLLLPGERKGRECGSWETPPRCDELRTKGGRMREGKLTLFLQVQSLWGRLRLFLCLRAAATAAPQPQKSLPKGAAVPKPGAPKPPPSPGVGGGTSTYSWGKAREVLSFLCSLLGWRDQSHPVSFVWPFTWIYLILIRVSVKKEEGRSARPNSSFMESSTVHF